MKKLSFFVVLFFTVNVFSNDLIINKGYQTFTSEINKALEGGHVNLKKPVMLNENALNVVVRSQYENLTLRNDSLRENIGKIFLIAQHQVEEVIYNSNGSCARLNSHRSFCRIKTV
jgi:hypothetical protein